MPSQIMPTNALNLRLEMLFNRPLPFRPVTPTMGEAYILVRVITPPGEGHDVVEGGAEGMQPSEAAVDVLSAEITAPKIALCYDQSIDDLDHGRSGHTGTIAVLFIDVAGCGIH